jgi:hypothetical protein
MRENRLYGSMRGGAVWSRELTITVGLIPSLPARLLYWRAFGLQPGVETPGYSQLSLRDKHAAGATFNT